jgi:RimJ/RimL family protein N-acetyltransferase
MLTELETPRLLLRQYRDSDLDDYAAAVADPEVMRHIGDGSIVSREDAWRKMAMILGHWQLRGYGLWAMEEKATGRLVGQVGFFFPEGWPGQEIGWLLSRGAWGKGYATEGAAAALARGPEILGADRVVAIIHPENERSSRLALRLGGSLDRPTEIRGIPANIYLLPCGKAVPAR